MNQRSIDGFKGCVLAVAAAFAGCATPIGGQDPGSAPADTTAAATAAPNATGTSLRVEEAARAIDVGRDVAGARAQLEAILSDPSTAADERDQALFALSKAFEAQGAREQATRTLEDLLVARVEDHRWPMQDAVQRRLYRLLTGSEQPEERNRDDDDAHPVAPFARVLTRFYPETTPGHFDIRILAPGGSDIPSDRLGTFNVAGAIRAMRREACPLCDDHLGMNVTVGRTGSWISIPAYRDLLPDALAIFYVDLEQGRIPSRYDALLPLSAADVLAHLDRGEGLIAVKERRGAPPAILIAAPRRAQLTAVEEKLAAMKSLPTEVVVVPVDAALQPGEIRRTLQAAKQAVRNCYDELVKRSPEAAGKVVFKFTIRGDGTVTDASVDAEALAMRDGTFQQCLLQSTGALQFPAIGGGKTTVTYPMTFSTLEEQPAH